MNGKSFSSLLIFASSLSYIYSTTFSVNEGINQIFDFSVKRPTWSYSSTLHNSTRTYIDACNPQIYVTSSGILLYEPHNHTLTTLHQLCSSRIDYNKYYLTITGANSLLHANVLFSVSVSLKGDKLTYTIHHVTINLNEDLMNVSYKPLNIDDLLVLQQELHSFLPERLLGGVHRYQQYLYNMKLLYACRHWKYSPQSKVIYGNINTDGLDVFVRIYDRNISLIGKERNRRQIFSNLHSPVFAKSLYNVGVFEEVSRGTKIVQAVAEDVDEGSAGTVRYSLHADIDQRSLSIFGVDPVTGWISTKARVDREDIAEHRFTVKAEDQGSPSNSAQTQLYIFVKDINDHAPDFEKPAYNINVSETETVGSTISRLQAHDADVGDNQVILYSFLTPRLVTAFSINRNTGDMSIAQPLDRETTSFYSIVVKAEDQAENIAKRLSSTITANIRILDYNDNTPLFAERTYSFRVPENINVSSGPVAVGIVAADDEDEADNGAIR